MSYSVDLRQKAVELMASGKSRQAVAAWLNISSTTLYRWQKRAQAGEALTSKKRGSFVIKIDPERVKAHLSQYPDHTLAEMKAALGASISGLWYRVKQLKLTLKKSHLLSRAR